MRNLREICHDLRTQDNRITSEPIFVVEERERIYGMDPDHGEDDWVIVDPQDTETIFESVEDAIESIKGYASVIKWIEDNDSNYEEYVEDNYEMVYYVERWKFVTVCFTENGCKEYLRRNAHNLGETRIFVYSGYRNDEWQLIRSRLMEKPLDKVKRLLRRLVNKWRKS